MLQEGAFSECAVDELLEISACGPELVALDNDLLCLRLERLVLGLQPALFFLQRAQFWIVTRAVPLAIVTLLVCVLDVRETEILFISELL